LVSYIADILCGTVQSMPCLLLHFLPRGCPSYFSTLSSRCSPSQKQSACKRRTNKPCRLPRQHGANNHNNSIHFHPIHPSFRDPPSSSNKVSIPTSSQRIGRKRHTSMYDRRIHRHDENIHRYGKNHHSLFLLVGTIVHLLNLVPLFSIVCLSFFLSFSCSCRWPGNFFPYTPTRPLFGHCGIAPISWCGHIVSLRMSNNFYLP